MAHVRVSIPLGAAFGPAYSSAGAKVIDESTEEFQ
jgi:hypothetical protein